MNGFAPVGFKSARFQIVVGSWSWFTPVMFGFQIGSGDDFFFIGVGLCLFVFVFVFVFVVCARG